MAYKKISFPSRVGVIFLLFIGLAQACPHDGRKDTLCGTSCPVVVMKRSSSDGDLKRPSAVRSPERSPVMSPSSAPAATVGTMSSLVLGGGVVSADATDARLSGIEDSIREQKEQLAAMFQLLQKQVGGAPGGPSRGFEIVQLEVIKEGRSRGSSSSTLSVASSVSTAGDDAGFGRGAGAFSKVLVGGERPVDDESDGSDATIASSDSDPGELGARGGVAKTPPRRRQVGRRIECPPTPIDGREHAKSGIFGRLLKDEVPAHRFYEDKALFLFAGTEYDRAQFELLIVCAYNPKLEMSCFETAWDRVPEVHSRALALNACFERLAGDLGLLSSGSSLTIKSNSGDTAKVKYPHQQFLHTMRGVIEGYKLTEDEVKILLNSVAFNTLFNALFHCYKDTYRGNNAVLHSRKHAHSSECVQRYAYGVLSREGGCLFDAVQMFKAKLRRYVAHVKDVDSVPNLDWLLELFPTRETWKNPVIWAQYQAYLAALRAGDDEPVPWEEYLTILADGEVEAD